MPIRMNQLHCRISVGLTCRSSYPAYHAAYYWNLGWFSPAQLEWLLNLFMRAGDGLRSNWLEGRAAEARWPFVSIFSPEKLHFTVCASWRFDRMQSPHVGRGTVRDDVNIFELPQNIVSPHGSRSSLLADPKCISRYIWDPDWNCVALQHRLEDEVGGAANLLMVASISKASGTCSILATIVVYHLNNQCAVGMT
jgi:hypothetical protein